MRYLLLSVFALLAICAPYAPSMASSVPSRPDAWGVATNCRNFIGTPHDSINFDAGFKKQTEVDYAAGGLVFSRIYRSDSTWTDNTIGALWRHNYARILFASDGSASITAAWGRPSSINRGNT